MPMLRRLVLLLACVVVLVAGPAAARVFYVGTGHQYQRPSQVAALVAPGDAVEIEPGEYYDCAIWRTDRLTIIGRGAGPVITDTQCADKAAFVINGDDVVLRNLTFARIRVPDRNGAGVRHQGQDLTIENCRFINNEIGLLSSAPATARITIRDSRFERNGLCVDGRCLPSVSVPAITVLRMERSVLTASRGGSLLRSGAVKTVLLGNAFGGGSSGTAETLLLASGDLRAEGNRFERDADAQEAPAITLRALWHTPEIIVRDNTLLNHGAHPAVLLENLSYAEPTLEGNTVDANDILVSNAGLLAARAKDTGHRTYDATAPLRSGLRHLEQKLMPK